MNTKLLVVGAILIITLGVVGYFGSKMYTNKPTGNSSEKVLPNESMPSAQSSVQSKVIAPSDKRYVDYSQSAFAEAANKNKKIIYYFHANWCPVCRPLDKEFSTNMDKIPAGFVVLKTDYDKEVDLKKKYNVTYQHTFIQVDPLGREITRWSGGGITELTKNVM